MSKFFAREHLSSHKSVARSTFYVYDVVVVIVAKPDNGQCLLEDIILPLDVLTAGSLTMHNGVSPEGKTVKHMIRNLIC